MHTKLEAEPRGTQHRGISWPDRLAAIVREPSGWIAVLVTVQVAVWTLVPWLLAISLPLDVVRDGISWGHEWQWGYFKHPPLPPWAVETFFVALGDFGPFLLSQICIAITFLFVFLLGRDLMPARFAAVGTVLLCGIYYFSIPTPEFNHNIAQLPVWAAASWLFLRAIRTPGILPWIALGAVCGMGMLTKYSCATLYAAMLLYLLATPSARVCFRTPGPYVAALSALAVFSPHLLWAAQHHFSTVGFFLGRAGTASGPFDRIWSPLNFLLAQIADQLPMLLMALGAGLLGRSGFRDMPPLRDDNFRFLVILGLGPALLTAVFSLATGFGLRSMWGTPMWNLSGLLLACATMARWPRISMKRLAVTAAALFVIMPAAYAIDTDFGPAWIGKPSRTQWPDRKIARAFAGQWNLQTHLPLKVVGGDSWIAGLIAMRVTPRPSVWIDADYSEAPWVTPARIAREGALIVWQLNRKGQPDVPIANLQGLRIMGTVKFSWPTNARAAPLKIGWGVIRPVSGNQ